MGALPQQIRDILTTSVCELYASNGITKASEQKDGVVRLDHCDFCAIIGFSGQQIKGHLLLAATHELLDHTHPSKAMGMPVGDDDYADWLGEIANQTVGRLKNSLLRFGINAAITTPTVIRGENINSYNLKSDSIKEILHFKLDTYDFLLEVHVDILAPIDFATVKEEAKAEDEGSSLFF